MKTRKCPAAAYDGPGRDTEGVNFDALASYRFVHPVQQAR